MDDPRYRLLADECLEQVRVWLEDLDPDEVDYADSDGVLTLEFADRQRYVLNRQAGAHQMWFAAGTRAWHYNWDEAAGRWVDDRDGHDLLNRIAGCVSEKLGREISITPDS